ncbi:MAG: hypothetical protein JSW25_01760 [Thermoplasmata archaeon]|nr:MAG: hypothetical protein JSW25_01760 [Thermoplasmata archaeon]
MPKVAIEAQRHTWESPMANSVTEVAVALRESMEALGWEFTREKGEKMYSRFTVVLPLAKIAYVFRFRVTEPLDDVRFDTWEFRFTHKGDITFIAVDDYRFEDLDLVHQLLSEMVSRLPRRPWDFPLGQRMEAGLALPEWGKARRMWQQMRFDVGERTPKDWVPKGSLGERQE